MKINYRKGKKKDSHRLAELMDMASGGAVEFLLHDLVPGLSHVEIVAANLEKDSYPHSFRNAIVAEYRDEIVGMSLSYPGHFHGVTEEMRGYFPADRLEHFKHFFSCRLEDTYFIDVLGVAEGFRNKGIGSELLARTKIKAKKEEYDMLSLIVFTDNTDAQRLYMRNGFEIIKKIELQPHKLIPHEGGCLLMKCAIAI